MFIKNHQFRPKFILEPGKIYEIVHYPSVGASTVALNIGLDYIIKVLLEEELPEIIPGIGLLFSIEIFR